MVYYNEFDPKAAAWLRELIKAGLIASGHVDERSIVDVRGSDLAGYNQCHFFAGIGGWSYALRLAGIGDDEPVWTGSCPCQPFSQAGKGKGESDSRHLWPDFRRLIEECRPPRIFGEQVASKAGRRWLDGVRADLEALDHEVGAADLCSPGVGAPHIRQRLYWVAQSEHAIGRPEHEEYPKTYGRNGLGGSREPCICPTECDCENFAGGLVSNNCPEHNGPWPPPQPYPECPADEHTNGARWVGDPYDSRSQGRRIDAGEYADQCAAGASGPSGGMGEPNGSRWITGRQAVAPAGCRDSTQPAGYWSDFDIVHCADDKARRIEPFSQQMAYGLSGGMGRIGSEGVSQIEKEIIDAAKAFPGPGKAVSNLWCSLRAEADEWPIGRYDGISQPPVLLAFMCQLAIEGWTFTQSIPCAGAEEAAAILRSLRLQQTAPCSPCGRKLEKQRGRESSDAVHILSSILARHAQAHWGEAYDKNAANAFVLAHGIPARMGRLRGYGNAIVPQVAAEFIRAYFETGKDRV